MLEPNVNKVYLLFNWIASIYINWSKWMNNDLSVFTLYVPEKNSTTNYGP